MQGTHIFRRDRTMQLINAPHGAHHPTIIKKMKTFLEVEGKMGPIPQSASSQYRPLQLDTNPKVRKDICCGEKKEGSAHKRFRPSAAPKPGKGAVQPPVTASKVPEAPENRPPALEKPKFAKALHGLALEECQETSLRTETGCSLPTT